MKLFQVLSLLFILVHLSYQEKIQPKIVNGHKVDIEDYPYQALVITSGFLKNLQTDSPGEHGNFTCGGSVISKTHILTVAHCVKIFIKNVFSFTADYVDVFLGSSIREEGENYVAKNWISHSEYDSETGIHDIAIVFLGENIVFSKVVRAIRLPVKPSSPKQIDFEGQIVFVTGWGQTSAYSEESSHLRGTKMVLSSIDSCSDMPKTKLCALISVNMPGHTYFGDSGGPAIINKTLYGVSSAIDRLLPDTTQCRFTSVIYYLDWIEETKNSNGEE